MRYILCGQCEYIINGKLSFPGHNHLCSNYKNPAGKPTRLQRNAMNQPFRCAACRKSKEERKRNSTIKEIEKRLAAPLPPEQSIVEVFDELNEKKGGE